MIGQPAMQGIDVGDRLGPKANDDVAFLKPSPLAGLFGSKLATKTPLLTGR